MGATLLTVNAQLGCEMSSTAEGLETPYQPNCKEGGRGNKRNLTGTLSWSDSPIAVKYVN